jgi:hypothetical protein
MYIARQSTYSLSTLADVLNAREGAALLQALGRQAVGAGHGGAVQHLVGDAPDARHRCCRSRRGREVSVRRGEIILYTRKAAIVDARGKEMMCISAVTSPPTSPATNTEA